MENVEKEVSEEKNTDFEINSVNKGQNTIEKVLHRNIEVSQQESEGINEPIFE